MRPFFLERGDAFATRPGRGSRLEPLGSCIVDSLELQGEPMIRALVVAAIMLVAASLEASAQDRMIFGEAGTSCRTWTQARQTKSRKAGLSAQWVAGYLSGSNVEADHPADVLGGTNFDGLMAWIDNYCRANPLDLVGTAALKLFDELKSRAQRR